MFTMEQENVTKDEMDAEKVASCISLIRGLGFQAIIIATNNELLNYLEK